MLGIADLTLFISCFTRGVTVVTNVASVGHDTPVPPGCFRSTDEAWSDRVRYPPVIADVFNRTPILGLLEQTLAGLFITDCRGTLGILCSTVSRASGAHPFSTTIRVGTKLPIVAFTAIGLW